LNDYFPAKLRKKNNTHEKKIKNGKKRTFPASTDTKRHSPTHIKMQITQTDIQRTTEKPHKFISPNTLISKKIATFAKEYTIIKASI
jgi:phage terminase large subunit GpA-like protein